MNTNLKRILLKSIRFYQKYISPGLGMHCRFVPTCSCYAQEAVERHGALKGALLAIWRVLRCNPFCRGGFDPVPDHFTFLRTILKEER